MLTDASSFVTKRRGVLLLKYDGDMSWLQALGWALMPRIWIFKPSPRTKTTPSLFRFAGHGQERAQRLLNSEVHPEMRLKRFSGRGLLNRPCP